LNLSFFHFALSPLLILLLGELSQNVALKQALKNGKAPGTNLELEVKGRMGGQCYSCSYCYLPM